MSIKPIDSRLPKLVAKHIESPFEKYKQRLEANDPKVLSQVYENQNGTCQQCNQSIYVIIRVTNQKTRQAGYLGLCEKHSEKLKIGTKILGSRSS